MNLESRLINGSIEIVVYKQMACDRDRLYGTIYVKFDDPNTGKFHEYPGFAIEKFRHCVPIIGIIMSFPYCHRSCTITVQKAQSSSNLLLLLPYISQ